MTEAYDYDCFLSHNSRDKPAVRLLAGALRDRGLSVWLDEECLRPGVPWQPVLESGIRRSRSIAVLVGASGLGPWEAEEMRAALSLALAEGTPVIPVLLADAPAQPALPLFLHGRTWVDMRSAADPDTPCALDLLIWGITGIRPASAPGAAVGWVERSETHQTPATGAPGWPARSETHSPPIEPPRPPDPRSVPIAPADTPLSRSVWDLLSPLPVAESVYRHHYRRTVSALGNERLAAAQGLSGMLAELAALRDTGPDRPVPAGLIEFLVRLGTEPDLAEPIGGWLHRWAGRQGHDLENASRRIRDEAGQRVLIVQLDSGEQDQVVGFQWFLRGADLRPVPGVAAGPRLAVTGWEPFVTALRATLDGLCETQAIGEIQFLVQAPLFDRSFHAIPTAEATLGEDFVVLVRYRERLASAARALPRHQPWRDRAAALRGLEPAAVPVLPIPAPNPVPIPVPAPTPIPTEAGFCYACFSVPAAPHSREKRILLEWLRAGVPYLAWPHQDPPGGDFRCLADCLAGSLSAARTLDQVPAKLTARRQCRDPSAQQSTLLWDDPDCHPFLTPRGIEVR